MGECPIEFCITLPPLPALRLLSMELCYDSESLSSDFVQQLAMRTGLRELDLKGCWNIMTIAPIALKLSSLQSLRLEGCDHLASIAPLAWLTGLTALKLSGGAASFSSMPVVSQALSGLIVLTELHVWSPELQLGQEPLPHVPKTRKLCFMGLTAATLAPLSHLTGLQELCISCLHHRCDVAALQRFTAMRKLRLCCSVDTQGGSGVDPQAFFGQLSGLQELHLGERDLGGPPVSPATLAALTQLSVLSKLALHDCCDLKDLARLKLLSDLVLMYLPTGCGGFTYHAVTPQAWGVLPR